MLEEEIEKRGKRKVIVWYCDICGKRITDDGPLSRLGGPVWELSSVSEIIFNPVKKERGEICLKIILCEECKSDLIYRIHEMIEQSIKDKRKEVK